MTRSRDLVLASAVACSLMACQPAPSSSGAPARAATPSPGTIPEPMPDTVAATPPGGAVDAVQVADATSPVAGGAFDARRFAGRYAGGGEAIEIMADGHYRPAQAGAAAAPVAAAAGGTWSIEAEARHVLLDADDKATPDRLFALAEDGSLRERGGTAVLHRATE